MNRFPRFCLVAGMALLSLTLAVRAEEGVLCLQNQLAALGFDPGPADGSAGPATRRALDQYETANGKVADRTLDAFSAIVFCRELGLRDAALTRHWPASGHRLRIEIADTPDDNIKAALLSEANAALGKVETLFKVRLAAPVDIVFGTEASKIAKRAEPFTASSAGAVGRFASGVCKDAPDYGVSMTHLPGVILICQQSGVVYHGGFDQREVRSRLGHMLAMEMIAQLTGDPANGSEEDYLRRTGPMWLVVGTMQLLQREVDGVITPLGRKTAAEKLRKDGVTNPRKMEYYSSSLEDAAGIGRTGLLVTEDLTRETGLALIGEFYRTLGTGASVDDAFQTVFGKSRAEVYEGYP